jgi:hypothetical protein
MVDPVTIGAVVTTIVTACIALIGALHIRKCKNPLCEVDCNDAKRKSLSPTNSTVKLPE